MTNKFYRPLAILMAATALWMVSPVLTPVYASESEDNVEIVETLQAATNDEAEEVTTSEKVEWVITPSIASWVYGETASIPEGSVSDGSSVIFTYSDVENGVYSSSQPTDAGDYYMKAVAGGSEKIVSFSIEKAKQKAPSLSVEGTTIVGIEDQMEYRSENSHDYSDLTSSTILEAGTYYVRYKEDDNHYASDEVSIIIPDGTTDTSNLDSNDAHNDDQFQGKNGEKNRDMPGGMNHHFPDKMSGHSKGQANNSLLKSTRALLKAASSSTSSTLKYTKINSSTHNPKKVTVTDTSLSSCTKTISYGDGQIIIKIIADDDLAVSIDSLQKLIDGCLTDSQKLKVANGKTITIRLTVTKSTLTGNDVTLLNTTIDRLNSASTTYKANTTVYVLIEKKWGGGSYTTIDENNRNFKLTISLLDEDTYQGIQIVDEEAEVVDDIDEVSNTFTYSIGCSGYYTLVKLTSLAETPKQTKTLPIYLLWIIPLAAVAILIRSKRSQIKEWIDNF